jgi:hypothetical protein
MNLRRKGENMEYIFTDKIKRRITLMSPLMTDAMEKRARDILKTVILGTVGKSIFEDKIHHTCELIRYLMMKLIDMPIMI